MLIDTHTHTKSLLSAPQQSQIESVPNWKLKRMNLFYLLLYFDGDANVRIYSMPIGSLCLIETNRPKQAGWGRGRGAELF